MKAYVVVDITVQDPERFKEYAKKSGPLVEKHGGTYLVRGGDVEIQEGTWSPQRLVVVEFPSTESAKSFMTDPSYQAVAKIRHESARTNMVIAGGFQAVS